MASDLTILKHSKSLRLKYISCEVLVFQSCKAMISSSDYISSVFLPKDAHNDPENLRKTIQAHIDEADQRNVYDAILLGYGLCGNSILGITARSIPIIIPKAHDCCTLFLGSRQRFIECFKDNFSAEWSSPGYIGSEGKGFHETEYEQLLGNSRTMEDIIAEHGEENAQYIKEMLFRTHDQKQVYFISDPEMDNEKFLSQAKKLAAEQNADLSIIEGNNRLINALIHRQWNDEFLLVPPGEHIEGVYDHQQIIKSQKTEKE